MKYLLGLNMYLQLCPIAPEMINQMTSDSAWGNIFVCLRPSSEMDYIGLLHPVPQSQTLKIHKDIKTACTDSFLVLI